MIEIFANVRIIGLIMPNDARIAIQISTPTDKRNMGYDAKLS
jgi:hypothetical protein